jgi:cytochrome P450
VIPSLKWSLETLGLSVSMDRQYMDGFQKAIVIVNDFVQQLVADREQGKRWRDVPDLLDILLEAKKAGRMTDLQIRDLLVFLFAAGYDTSKNVLTLMMHELVQRPEIYARCAEDFVYCQKVVEETMRFHSPTSTNRLLTDDIVYRDVLLPKGTSLWFPWAIIGRDSSTIEDADEFRPEREQKHPHMGFALGAHLCLGQFIARAQLAESLHLIAQRIKNPKSPGPLGWRPFPGVWGIKGLPIEFEPAPAREAIPA